MIDTLLKEIAIANSRLRSSDSKPRVLTRSLVEPASSRRWINLYGGEEKAVSSDATI